MKEIPKEILEEIAEAFRQADQLEAPEAITLLRKTKLSLIERDLEDCWYKAAKALMDIEETKELLVRVSQKIWPMLM